MVSITFQKHTLSNGLDVILHEDHNIPLVSVNVWYHVGSKDEEVGRTGFAHLFEHVMFEGSKHHNRSHFEPLQKAGASLNGSTTMDRTNYWEDVPSNYLELALWLESDRMGFLLDALDQQRFDVQREVVKNERRQSYENRPYGMAHWHIQSALFPPPHPYNWMTIGSQEDLDAASVEDVKAFFRRFYSPSNASLCVAGDIDPARALELVNNYFGDLPPGPPVRRVERMASPLQGRVELEMLDKVTLPRLYVAWPAPPAFDALEPAADLLQAVLSDGLSSRLYRSLVYDKQVAQSASARYYSAEIAGEFSIEVTAAPGHSLTEAEEALDAELERLRREPPTDEELARVKNRLEATHYRQLARVGGFGGRADQLNHFNVFAGKPELINTSIEEYLRATREEVAQAAAVLGSNQVRMRVLPEPALKSAAPAVDRAVMPGPAPEPEFTPPLPVRRKLSNGLGVLVVEKPGLPVVAFGLMVSTGGSAADPAERPGLASFTARLLQEGTSRRNSQQVAEDFEFMGARLSVDTRREYSSFSTETLTKHWPDALKLLAEVVMEPTFPNHELERARRERLTDLRRAKDDGGFVADQVFPKLIFGEDNPYGRPVSGDEASLTALTRDEVAGFHRRHFGPAVSTLLVAGDVTAEEALAQAEVCFGAWQTSAAPAPAFPGALPESQSTVIYLVDRPGAAQSVLRAGHLTVSRHHPDYFALTLVNYAFGGQFSARLNQNLRQDKGYTYGFHSSIQWQRGPSALVAGGSVETKHTRESVRETLHEFNGVHSVLPLSADEMNNSKTGILRGFPSNFEQPSQALAQLAQLELHGLPDDYYQTVRPKLAGVTLEETHRAAREQVKPDHLAILVVGDRAQVEEGLRELGLPLVILDKEGRRLG